MLMASFSPTKSETSLLVLSKRPEQAVPTIRLEPTTRLDRLAVPSLPPRSHGRTLGVLGAIATVSAAKATS